ncbi:MAG: peptide chain release factor N(5)-glutamine methyltransferase [Desulfobacula sp.]|nr:peptide chain release factor N(5)-glutamine methyltransferase [Desulfobacula sp.]
MNSWTIIKLLSWAESYFKNHSIDSPRLTGELLLAYTLDIKRLELYLQHDRPLSKKELSYFKVLIKKRVENQPLAYIVGRKGFYDSDFTVTKDVLIPRPDTETLVEQALKVLKQNNKPCNILELGTGSGAVIISIAKKMPDHYYFASDFSSLALDIAQKNARKIVKDKILFFASNWFAALHKKPCLDLIISNPPYIPSKDISALAPEIRNFEPMLALDGGKDGLDSFRTILKNADNYLVSKGVILFEMGFDQKEGLINIVNKYSYYKSIKFIKDLAGHNRVAVIKKL